jgi:hypothetical protein
MVLVPSATIWGQTVADGRATATIGSTCGCLCRSGRCGCSDHPLSLLVAAITLEIVHWHVLACTCLIEPSACTESTPPLHLRKGQQLLSSVHTAPDPLHPPNTAFSWSGFSFLALKGNPSIFILSPFVSCITSSPFSVTSGVALRASLQPL